MRTLKTMVCLLMVVTALATGCKKDKDESEPESSKNNYTYLDATTKITGAKFNYVTVIGVNTLSVVLTGEGTSKWVQLFFYKSGTTIPTGAFTYKTNVDNSYNPATNFSGGNVNLDIASAHEINGGTLNVTKDGDNYTITLDAKTSRGPVKATYVGKITAQ